MEITLLAFWIFLIAAGLSIVGWTLYNGISPMFTSFKVKKKLFDALPKELHGGIYDLGSGWGTLIIPLANRYAHCLVVGYETSPVPYAISKIRAAASQLANVKIQRQDFMHASLKDASMVICYLYPGAMAKLKVKLREELAPGTWVVSHTFAIPGWAPHTLYEVNDLYRTKIYVYRMDTPEPLITGPDIT